MNNSNQESPFIITRKEKKRNYIPYIIIIILLLLLFGIVALIRTNLNIFPRASIGTNIVVETPSPTPSSTPNAPVGFGPTFTQGSVIFQGPDPSHFSENNQKFFWDNSNFFLGIGTNLPSAYITISGSPGGAGLALLQSQNNDYIIRGTNNGVTVFNVSSLGNLGIAGTIGDLNDSTLNVALNLATGGDISVGGGDVTSSNTLRLYGSTSTTLGLSTSPTFINGSSITFKDANLLNNITLTKTATALPNGNTGIVDAIVDAYNHAGSGSGNPSFSSITSGTNTGAAMVVGSGASLTFSGTGTITASEITCSGCVSNSELANSSITFAGDSGSSPISLGGTINIVGAGSVTTSQSGSTLTITGSPTSVSPDSLDFTEFKDAMTLDASTDIATAGFTLSTSGTGALNFASTGQVTFAGNVDMSSGLDVTGTITQNGFAVCDSSGANCPFSGGYWQLIGSDLSPTSATYNLAIGGTNSSAPFYVDAATGNTTAGNLTLNGSTGITANGNGAGITFFGIGNHNIQVTAGTLRLGAFTLLGTVSANTQTITNVGTLDFGTGNLSVTGNTVNLTDNIANALDIQQGTDNYINVDTTNTTEKVTIGNSSISTTSVELTKGATGNIILTGFNCTTFTAGGALTTDASGNVMCSNDDTSGSSSTIWSDLTDPTANLTLNMGAFTTTFNWTGTGSIDPFTLNFTNNAAGATTQNVFSVTNAVTASIGDTNTESLIHLDNADTSATGSTFVDNAILITNSGGIVSGITDAIDASDPQIDNAINIGSNNIAGANFNVTGTTGDTSTNGNLTVNGNTFLGNASTDSITFNGEVASNILPNLNNTYDLGSALLQWANIYGVNIFQNGFQVCDSSGANCPVTTQYWTQTLGALYPSNNSVDLLVGADSTAAAKFAFTGVSGGLPTASIAGNVASVATYLTGNGNLSTTNAQDLTIGSSFTGQVILNSRGSNALTANGPDVTILGNLAVNGGDLTTTATTFNLLTGATTALNIGPPGATGSLTLSGGSGDTGCTLDGTTGNLSCSGDITTTSLSGTQGWWQRNLGVLSPANITDDLAIGGIATGSATFHVLSGTGDVTADGFVAAGGVGQFAGTTTTTYSRFGTSVADHFGTPVADDLLITGRTEFRGNLYLDSADGAGSGGLFTIADFQGTGVIIFPADPISTEHTLSAGSWLIDNSQNVGQAALMVNQRSTVNDIFDASSSGAIQFQIKNNGDTVVGPTGLGKITVGTVDPPYTINGQKYATYLPGMAGVKEEVTGNLQANEYIQGVGYRSVIDFNDLTVGSDLWLFGKATDIKNNMDSLVALLTPSDPTGTWYEVDKANGKLAIYSARPTTISYRLTGPRFDSADHPNSRLDAAQGFVLNIPDIPNTNAFASTVRSFSDFLIEKASENVYRLKTSTGTVIDGIESMGNLIAANIKTGSIQVGLISPVENSDLNVKLNQKSKFNIQNADQNTVASVDDKGNATFSGTLTSQELTTGTIKSKSLDDIQKLLAQVQTDQSTLSDIVSTDLASTSGNFSDLIAKDLYVTSQAVVNTLSVTDNLSFGTNFIFKASNSSINSMATPLKIEDLAAAPVEIMAGMVTIDTKGNVNISGNLAVHGKIQTSSISLGGAENKFANVIEVSSTGGTILAAVDASGSATFNKIQANQITGSDEQRGSVEILPAEDTKNITRSWSTAPSAVFVSPSYKTQAWVDNITPAGFTIHISDSPPDSPQKLYWWALW